MLLRRALASAKPSFCFWGRALQCRCDGVRRGSGGVGARRLPFRAENECVEGHPLQGDGCSPRNLEVLIRATLQTPKFDTIVEFLMQALKQRRQFRHERVG